MKRDKQAGLGKGEGGVFSPTKSLGTTNQETGGNTVMQKLKLFKKS